MNLTSAVILNGVVGNGRGARLILQEDAILKSLVAVAGDRRVCDRQTVYRVAVDALLTRIGNRETIKTRSRHGLQINIRYARQVIADSQITTATTGGPCNSLGRAVAGDDHVLESDVRRRLELHTVVARVLNCAAGT